jgi:hypothetical protein
MPANQLETLAACQPRARDPIGPRISADIRESWQLHRA